jgi:hypothetical protein
VLFGNGIGSTTTGDIPSLNAFAIYAYAFFIIPGSLFLMAAYFFILKPCYQPFLVLLFMLSLFGSGSLLMYQYPLLVVVSRKAKLSSLRLRTN